MSEPTGALPVPADAVATAAAVRSGEIAPDAPVRAAIAEAERLNPALNAIVSECYERAVADAARVDTGLPFAGVPLLVKDNQHSIGTPTRFASRYFADAGPSSFDHPLVARLRAAGFVPIGKTNMPELGLQAASEPELYGPAHNPWDLARTCGGSSGGSAAAVAAGIVAVATGGDGGGSIRIPAAACGVVGLKPSRGRTPGLGWAGLAVNGVMTRSVRDTAATLDLLARPGPGHPAPLPLPAEGSFVDAPGSESPPLRVGVCSGFGFGEPEPEIWRAVLATASDLATLGHDVEETSVDVRQGGAGPILDDVYAIVAAALARQVQSWEHAFGREASEEQFEALTWAYIDRGRQLPATALLAGMDVLSQLAMDLAPVFATYDVLLTPTVAECAPLLGSWQFPAEDPMSGWERMGRFMPPFLTQLANYLGHPAISLPLHMSSTGLPIGIQLMGRFAEEYTLLALAGALERLRPWERRLPALAGGSAGS